MNLVCCIFTHSVPLIYWFVKSVVVFVPVETVTVEVNLGELITVLVIPVTDVIPLLDKAVALMASDLASMRRISDVRSLVSLGHLVISLHELRSVVRQNKERF